MTFVERLIHCYRAWKQTEPSKKNSAGDSRPEDPIGVTYKGITEAKQVLDNLVNIRKLYEASRDLTKIHANGINLQAYLRTNNGGHENVGVDLAKIPGAMEVVRKLLIPYTKGMMKELHRLGIRPEQLTGMPETDEENVDYD